MDLVIQAPEIPGAVLSSVASLAEAQGITVLHDADAEAFRLSRIAQRTGVAELCAESRIDCAFVPPDLRRRDVRVVALDMDSTLITIECIDEVADMLGIKPQVAAITESAMRGEIDFRASLAQRVALLAGLPATALERVYDERLELSPGAERMLDGFRAAGAVTLLVSGGFSFFADRLQARLHLDEVAANVLEISEGHLTGRLVGTLVDAQEKAARLAAMKARLCADGGIAVAIGDGANDLPMLEMADVSIAYHAKPVLRERTTFALDHCGLDAALNLFR